MKNRKSVTYTHTQQTIDAFNNGTLRTIGGQPVTSRRVLDATPASQVVQTSRAQDALQRLQGHSVAQAAQPAAPMLSRSQEAVLRMAQATPQPAAPSSGSVVVSRAQEALARMAGGDK